MRSFLDSNILVYTDDQDAPEKQGTALTLIEQLRLAREGVISTQVLQEYFVAATRKLGVPADTARRKIQIFSGFDLVPADLDLILSAVDLHRLYSLSFWDALIVRAALASGCIALYSEDLQHKQAIEGLRIINPFIPT